MYWGFVGGDVLVVDCYSIVVWFEKVCDYFYCGCFVCFVGFEKGEYIVLFYGEWDVVDSVDFVVVFG